MKGLIERLRISVPIISKPDGELLIRVDCDSPLQHRKAVRKMAEFFHRESCYDFVMYGRGGKDTDPKHVAFLFLPHEAGGVTDLRIPCVGGTCFRWREWTDSPPGYAMQWVWMHPFYRRKKLLSRAWPEFRKQFGDFHVEPPLSDAMKAFLNEIEK